MFKPYINIPAEDVRILEPTSMCADYQLVFTNVDAIDRTIELLEDIKVVLVETERQTSRN